MKIQLSDHFNYRKLLRFTMPTIIMMIFTSVYGIVDGIFVSNFTGKEPFTAINVVFPMLMAFASIGLMFGTGGSALVSKTLGEGNKVKANKIFSLLVYTIIVLGAALSTLGLIFLKPILSLIGATNETLEYCITYGQIMMIGLPAFLLQNAFQSFFTVAEKPHIGLTISVLAGITNILFDFLFIIPMNMGILGAAIATVMSAAVGGLTPIIYFAKKNSSPLRLTKTKFYGKELLRSAANGSSEMMTQLSSSLVNMLYNIQLVKYLGNDGIAAYGFIMYVNFIFIGTYIGFSIGSSSIVGYHYGAQNHEELKGLLKKGIVIIGITAVIMYSLAFLLSNPLATIFVGYDKDLLDLTVNGFRLFSLSFIFCGFNIFGSAFFTALNNGGMSALISFSRTLVLQIICILALPVIIGTNGIWLAVVIAEGLTIILTAALIIANRKKYKYM